VNSKPEPQAVKHKTTSGKPKLQAINGKTKAIKLRAKHKLQTKAFTAPDRLRGQAHSASHKT
jgi:hypothetical protein